jgi:hypothetical protein
MKKYFLHNGREQQGPFDLEDLKAKQITGDTMVWYEGLSEWSKASSVPELQSILSQTPPPFQSKTPPTFNQVNTSPSTNPSKIHALGTIFGSIGSFLFSIGRGLAIVIVVLIAVVLGIKYFTEKGSSAPFKVEVNPPKPRLVESHGNEDPSSTIFHFHEGVYATVLNEGGSGKVLVKAILTQDGNTYERSEDVFMGANQTRDFHFNFTEPSRTGGKMEYYVTPVAM